MPPLFKGVFARWAGRAFLSVCFGVCGLGSAQAMDDGTSLDADDSPMYQQIEPELPVREHFRASELSLAIAAVPDPRVPRHRRAYDLSIVALIQGMIDTGYVLDRYSFPWEEALRQTSDAKPKKADDGKSKQEDDGKRKEVLLTDDCKFGLMIFRRDNWRRPTSSGQAPALRALYLVPETNTYGVPRGTMFAAMRAIRMQQSKESVPQIPPGWCPPEEVTRKDQSKMLAPAFSEPSPDESARAMESRRPAMPSGEEIQSKDAGPGRSRFPIEPKQGRFDRGQAQPPVQRIHLAKHSRCHDRWSQGDPGYLLVIGPNFSGSVDSLAQINHYALRAGLPRICAVSASATASSNVRISAYPYKHSIEFNDLANDDVEKFADLWRLAEQVDADSLGEIAILSEATVFGHEVCPPQTEKTRGEHPALRKKFCDLAVKISFPSNIADVRAGLPKRTARSTSLSVIAPASRSLQLEDGTGNGSEFPDSLQSKLTTVGTELELRRAIKMLAKQNPRLIVVVATDVRDRLFLFDLLREGVPYAQLVDLELDLLMTHPDYMHATRGAVLVGSERTTAEFDTDQAGDAFAVASTDYQGLLRRLIHGLDYGGKVARSECPFAHPVLAVREDQPILHVVSRNGVVPLDCLDMNMRWTRSWLTPLLGALGILLLMRASPPIHALLGQAPVPGELSKGFCQKLRKCVRVDDPAINHWVLSHIVGVFLLLVAAWLGGGKEGLVMALIPAPILCWALAYQAGVYELNSTRPRRFRSSTRAWRWTLHRHWLALQALLLVVVLAEWLAWQEISGKRLALVAIANLAYSADQGMAIGVAMTVAVLGLLFTDNALSVARSASRRNRRVVLKGLWKLPEWPGVKSQLEGMFAVGVLPFSLTMSAGLLMLSLCIAMAIPFKTGMFGLSIAVLAVIAVVSLSLMGLAFLANAVRMHQRLTHITRVLHSLGMRSQGASGCSAGPEGAFGLWPAAQATDIRFATTPAAARIKDAGPVSEKLIGPKDWVRLAQGLSVLRSGPHPVRKATRVALYVLLASEVSQTRWATFSSVACSLAVTAFVYLYPVSGANGFALFALGLLIVTGLFAGYTAMTFERNEVMSNILCNRTAKAAFSATLFNYTAFPFVVLALSLAIVQVPGVLDWSEGLFKTLLNISSGKGWG